MSTSTIRFRQFLRIAVKELREILRDRRTIITLVLMPLFLYPLLGGVVQKVLLSSITSMADGPTYILGFESEEDMKVFNALIGAETVEEPEPDEGAPAREPSVEPSEAIKSLIGPAVEPAFSARVPEDGAEIDLEKLAADRAIDVGIRFIEQNRNGIEVEFIYQTGNKFTRDALNAIRSRVAKANVAGLLRISGRSEEPIKVTETTVEPIQGGSAVSMVTFIPLALILMTVTGAVYPAIDLTAGERERGTLETLIAAPVSRLGLLMAKFVAVLTVAMLTALINLLAMLITLYTVGLDKAVFGEDGMSFGTIALVLALLLVFAGFFSAVLLSVTSFAKSFKEAQAYLIPLMLVSLTPGIFSLMPDIHLNGLLAIVPLVNVVLASRDVLQGFIDPTMLAIAMASTIVYGMGALLIATRVFGTDAILYGSDGTWGDLLQRPAKTTDYPPVSTGILCLVVLVPTFMVMAAATGRIEEVTMSTRLTLNMVVLSMFVLVPLAFVVWNRYRMRTTFNLMAPAPLAICGAILLGVSLWPFAFELTALATGDARTQELHKLFAPMKEKILEIPLPLRLLALAITPAVCEEWFFRGALLTSLLNAPKAASRRKQWMAILITSAIFAAFHVLVQDKLFFERFLPSCMMGVVLGWICVRTGSLFPGMILHVLHNGLLLAAADYESELAKLGLGLENQQHLPAIWLAGAATFAVIGVAMVWVSTTRQPKEVVALASNESPTQ